MRRIVPIAVIAAFLVYPVYSIAQPKPTAPTPMHMSAPAPVMSLMEAPKPAAMAPVAAMPAEMAPPAPVMAPEAMSPAPPVMAPSVAKSSEKPAEAASKPKESTLDKADRWIGLITKMLSGLLLIIGAILGAIKGSEWRNALKSGRWANVLEYARKYAFPGIEAISKSTGWKGDDKLAEFLKRMDDWLEGEGERPLSANEVKLLKREAADMAATDKAHDGRKVDEKAVKRRKG